MKKHTKTNRKTTYKVVPSNIKEIDISFFLHKVVKNYLTKKSNIISISYDYKDTLVIYEYSKFNISINFWDINKELRQVGETELLFGIDNNTTSQLHIKGLVLFLQNHIFKKEGSIYFTSDKDFKQILNNCYIGKYTISEIKRNIEIQKTLYTESWSGENRPKYKYNYYYKNQNIGWGLYSWESTKPSIIEYHGGNILRINQLEGN